MWFNLGAQRLAEHCDPIALKEDPEASLLLGVGVKTDPV
jgi:hypothetical protein